MRIRDTETQLLAMLAESGITPGVVSVDHISTVVAIFHEFATIRVHDAAPADQDGDAVLAQFGTYTFRGPREFSTDLTRQCAEVGDEDAPMWQLHCTFHWAPNARTDNLDSGSLWSFGMPLETFFDQATALPGWAWALDAPPAPQDLSIGLHQV